MNRLLGVIFSYAASWNTRPVAKIRDSAIAITVLPFVLLLAAGIVGRWSWEAKLWIVEFQLFVSIVLVLVLAARRGPLALEISAAVAAGSPSITLGAAVERYLRAVASIVEAQIFAGLAVLWFPVHGNLSLAFLGVFVGVGYLFYWFWTGEDLRWWRRTVNTAIGLTLFAVVSGVVIPTWMPETGETVRRVQADHTGKAVLESVHALFRGTATGYQAFMAVGIAAVLWWLSMRVGGTAVARGVAVGAGTVGAPDTRSTGGPATIFRGVATATLAFLLLGFVGWYFWGEGSPGKSFSFGGGRPAAEESRRFMLTDLLSPPITLPDCTSWNVYPDMGGRAEGVFADDPTRTLYHFPHTGELKFHGPLHLRGEGPAALVLREIGTYCHRMARVKAGKE